MKKRFSRRRFIKTSTLAAGAGLGLQQWLQEAKANPLSVDAIGSPTPAPEKVSLRLLDGAALSLDAGVSFGVPWPEGSVKRDATFNLTSESRPLPLQTWPLAYWPDGSLKWSGFATVVPAGLSASLSLSPGPSQVAGALQVTRNANSMIIDTGALKCVISTAAGPNLFESISVDGRAVVGAGRLVCILQNGPETDPEDSPAREQFLSVIKKVTAEQTGPVRAVVKFEGFHKGTKSGREWLPFIVRFYFYTGQKDVRVVHTITFDGNQEKDFVRGLGIRIQVPLREEQEIAPSDLSAAMAASGRNRCSRAAAAQLRKPASPLPVVESLPKTRFGMTSNSPSRTRTASRSRNGLILKAPGFSRRRASGLRVTAS